MASFAPQHHRHQAPQPRPSLARLDSASSVSSLSSSSAVLLFAPPESQRLHARAASSDASPSIGSNISLSGSDARATTTTSRRAAAAAAGGDGSLSLPCHAGDGTFSLSLSSNASTTSSFLSDEDRASLISNSSDAVIDHTTDQAWRHLHLGHHTTTSGGWHKLTAEALDTLHVPSRHHAQQAQTRTPYQRRSVRSVSSSDGSQSQSWNAVSSASIDEQYDSYLALSAGISLSPRSRAARGAGAGGAKLSRKRRAVIDLSDDRSSQKRSNRSVASSDTKENVVPFEPATPTPSAVIDKQQQQQHKDVFLSSLVRKLVDDETMDLFNHHASSTESASHVSPSTTPRATSPFWPRAADESSFPEGLHGFALLSSHANSQLDAFAPSLMQHHHHAIETIVEEESPDHPPAFSSLADSPLFFPSATSKMTETDHDDDGAVSVSRSMSVPNFEFLARLARLRSQERQEEQRDDNDDVDDMFDDEYGQSFRLHDRRLGAQEGRRRRATTPPPSLNPPWGGEFEGFQAALSYWKRVLSVFRWSSSSSGSNTTLTS